MAGPGFYTTARGEVINMDDLQQKAKQPLVQKAQPKSTVKKRDYNERKPLNVRGFQPAQGVAKLQTMPDDVAKEVEKSRIIPEEQPQPSSFNESGEVETLEDMTGVKVRATPEAVARAKARIEKDIGVEEASQASLNEILGDLKESNPNAEAAADVAEAEEKKKSTTTRSRSRKAPASKTEASE